MSVEFFKAIEPLLITLLTGTAVTLTAYLIRLLRQQFSQAQWQLIQLLVAMAVQAAEQYGGDNETKKRQALELAQEALAKHGVHLDLLALDTAIEAAVWKEINQARPA